MYVSAYVHLYVHMYVYMCVYVCMFLITYCTGRVLLEKLTGFQAV